MDDNDMQKQIDDRKVQAAEREIFRKAVHAAYHLGKGIIDIRRTTNGDRETKRVYNDPDAGFGLTIDFDRTAHHGGGPPAYETLEILEGEETVFLQRGGTIEGYVPGDWEVELDKLQYSADRAKETMTAAAERDRHASGERGSALRKAWGLSAEDSRSRGSDEPKPRIGGVVEQPPRRRRR